MFVSDGNRKLSYRDVMDTEENPVIVGIVFSYGALDMSVCNHIRDHVVVNTLLLAVPRYNFVKILAVDNLTHR